MTIQSGTLQHQVVIKSITDSVGARGGIVETESDFATVFASIEPLRGRERYEAQRVDAEINHRIRMHYVAGVTPKMRIVFGTQTFDIKSVVNVRSLGKELEILATECV